MISLICMTHPNPIHSKLVTGVRRTCEPSNKVLSFRNQELGVIFDNSPTSFGTTVVEYMAILGV